MEKHSPHPPILFFRVESLLRRGHKVTERTSPAAATFSTLQKAVLAILAAVQFMHVVDFMVIMPLARRLEMRFAISTNEFGWLVSGYTFAAFVAGILGSLFIDRISRKTSLLVGMVGFIVGNLVCAAANDFRIFFVGRVVTGAFGGFLNGIIFSAIGDLIEPEKRGRATGIIMMAFSLAAVVGVPAGIWLAGRFSLHFPFYLIAAGSALVLVLATLRMPRLDAHLQNERGSLFGQIRLVFADEKNRRLYLMMVFHFIAGFSIIPFIANFMQKNNGVTDDQLFWVYVAGGLATIISSPLAGALTDKHGAVRMYSLLSLSASIPFILVTYEWTKYFPLLLFFAVLFFVFVSGRMVPAIALLNNTVEPTLRGTFMSLNGSVQQLAMSLGATAASFIIIAPPGQPIQNYLYVGVFGILFNIAAIAVANTFKSVK